MPQDPSTSGPDEPKGDQGPEVNEHQDQRKGTEPEGEQPAKGTEPEELTAERTAREAAEKRATEAEAEASRLRRSNAAQKPGDLDALREEIRSEFAAQLVRAEVRAAAAGRLRDPADALALVDVAALTSKGARSTSRRSRLPWNSSSRISRTLPRRTRTARPRCGATWARDSASRASPSRPPLMTVCGARTPLTDRSPTHPIPGTHSIRVPSLFSCPKSGGFTKWH